MIEKRDARSHFKPLSISVSVHLHLQRRKSKRSKTKARSAKRLALAVEREKQFRNTIADLRAAQGQLSMALRLVQHTLQRSDGEKQNLLKYVKDMATLLLSAKTAPQRGGVPRGSSVETLYPSGYALVNGARFVGSHFAGLARAPG